MRLTENVRKAINDQINAEMWSANLYLSMSMHFNHIGYDGFASWLFLQSKEEMDHAYQIADYLNRRGGKVEIAAIDAVPVSFGTPLEVFESVYKHECKVSEMIEEVVKVAHNERDMATQDFFWQFVREQVEEEEIAAKIIDQIKLAGDQNLIFVDAKLGQRSAGQE